MCLTKVGVLNWYSSMKKKFRKIRTIFDIEKWLWKSEFCNFVSLSTLSEKVQKKFQCNFCDSASISFIVISFHQILLTWWNAYDCDYDYDYDRKNKVHALSFSMIFENNFLWEPHVTFVTGCPCFLLHYFWDEWHWNEPPYLLEWTWSERITTKF